MCFSKASDFWRHCLHTGLPKSYQEALALSVSLDIPLWHELFVVLCSGPSFSWVATCNAGCQYCTTIGLPNFRGWVDSCWVSAKPHDSRELHMWHKQGDFVVSVGVPSRGELKGIWGQTAFTEVLNSNCHCFSKCQICTEFQFKEGEKNELTVKLNWQVEAKESI